MAGGAACGRRARRVAWVAAVVLAVLAAACDMGPVPPTATAMPSPPPLPTNTPGPPLAQGWIVELPTQDDNFTLRRPVLAAGGLPGGSITVTAGWTYAAEGAPALIGAIRIAANDQPVLELVASDEPAYRTDPGPRAVAQLHHAYEQTTPAGWHVRVTVSRLAVTAQPVLPDGTLGARPVFADLELHVDLITPRAAPYLGITADPVSPALAALENLRGPDAALLDHGFIIRSVAPDGPAAQAGLRMDDVILSINNDPLSADNPLPFVLSLFQVGERVTLDVARAGQIQQMPLTLAPRP